MINLLDELQDEFHLSYVFVAHDLSVVRHVSDRIAVMYLGKIMELSPAEELYTKPIHPYTIALLSAIPIPDPSREPRPHADNGDRRGAEARSTRPQGCRFARTLPVCDRGLPDGRAAADRVRGRPSGGLPPPAERHRRGDRAASAPLGPESGDQMPTLAGEHRAGAGVGTQLAPFGDVGRRLTAAAMRFPAEWERHERTLMGWPCRRRSVGRDARAGPRRLRDGREHDRRVRAGDDDRQPGRRR